MTKSDLITVVAEKAGIKNKDAKQYVELVLGSIYDALAAAKAALVVAPADKTELADLLVLAAVLKEEDYAADDWADYVAKVAEAQAVMDADNVTVSQVADAAKALARAIKAINGGELPPPPVEEQPTEEPTEEPTAAPTEKPTEKPTEAPTAAPTEPTDDEGGCGGIIGASAVVVAVVLGAVVLKKKED